MCDFIVIGENLHCSRTVKTNGPRVRDGAIVQAEGVTLPVPAAIRDGAEWAAGTVRPCAVAVEAGLHGDSTERAAGTAFIRALAATQVADGSDVTARCEAIRWLAATAQAAAVPLSIDSSQPAVLEAGLAACDHRHGRPLLNSLSLERREAIALAARLKVAVVASAAGANSIPNTAAERLANLARLTALLAEAGIVGDRLFFDPLVLPVGVDPVQPGVTLAVIRELRRSHGEHVHITGGFSNVSFGMPQRRLLNEVFIRLALEAGADSGIVDPLVAGPARIAALDPTSERFRLAAAVLKGEDPYGAEFLAAARDGRLA